MKASNKAKIFEKITEIIDNLENVDSEWISAKCNGCGDYDIEFDDEMISYSIYNHEEILKSLAELSLYIENEEYKEVKASKQQLSIF